MKHLKVFNESNKETIPVKELIDDLKQSDPDNFGYSCEEDGDKGAMAYYDWEDMPSSKFEFVDKYSVKGDYKDESTDYGIFKRVSDGKLFRFWIHDAGLIGPITITMCDVLEEVDVIEKTIKVYN